MTEAERKILIDAIKNVHCSNFDSSPQSVKYEITLVVEALTEGFVQDTKKNTQSKELTSIRNTVDRCESGISRHPNDIEYINTSKIVAYEDIRNIINREKQ